MTTTINGKVLIVSIGHAQWISKNPELPTWTNASEARNAYRAVVAEYSTASGPTLMPCGSVFCAPLALGTWFTPVHRERAPEVVQMPRRRARPRSRRGDARDRRRGCPCRGRDRSVVAPEPLVSRRLLAVHASHVLVCCALGSRSAPVRLFALVAAPRAAAEQA